MTFRPFNRLILLAALTVSACAPSTLPPETMAHRSAAAHLKEARRKSLTTEQRAILYLEAAREASALLDSPDSSEPARIIYNDATNELTMLLRSTKNGTLWNQPVTLSSNGTSYRLKFTKPTSKAIWDAGMFTSFAPAAKVDLKTIKYRNLQKGTGGAIVGIQKTYPPKPFSPAIGITAPVTTTLDFKGNDATLSLINPTELPRSRVAGKERPLDADFTAPLAYYPQPSELREGLMGALRVSSRMGTTGLYMLEPYDPDRIPLIFVHGLISTPRMWRNVINEIKSDPVLCARYQCWVFSYPTGNPVLYSALRLREELEKMRKLHPDSRDAVLIGHSMGGLLSRIQVTTVDHNAWKAAGNEKALQIITKFSPGSFVERATNFRANPHVARTIFICTPHRGSDMAIGTLGDLAVRLISLPADLTNSFANTVGNSIAMITGDPARMPTSIDGLSPNNLTLKMLDSRPIAAPHHSIIGDRGKSDTPNSSDGVVKYWSSHLKSAQSEKIVPGPHGSCEHPETIKELRRLLHLHLSTPNP